MVRKSHLLAAAIGLLTAAAASQAVLAQKPGGILKIQATQLGVGQNLTFDGSAEQDGSFLIYGGNGNDSLTGGKGNDGFYFGPGQFDSSDMVNGGLGGNDQLALDGIYGGFGPAFELGGNITNVEVVVLLPGPSGSPNSFNLTTSESFVPSATRANLAYAYASSSVRRPPGSTPTPPLSRASDRPVAARSSASGQLAGTRPPDSSRTNGVVRRSSCVALWNAHRPLSQLHSSLTSGSSLAKRRVIVPRRQSFRRAQPDEQCSQTVLVLMRSNGRARKR